VRSSQIASFVDQLVQRFDLGHGIEFDETV
jgi:hypothetical protein